MDTRARQRRRAGPIGALLVALLAVVAVGGLARTLASPASTSPFDGPLGACRIDDRVTPLGRPGDWARTLLDPEYALRPGDVPGDLVPLADAGIDGRGSLRAFVLDDLAAMAADARTAGESFRITSAFRSFDQQTLTFDSLVAAKGREAALLAAARPGHSEHQLGTTIDVEGGTAWLAEHAARYGFVLSYPAAFSPWTTCYQAEPWHFRYLGRDDAERVAASDLSLREWLWPRQGGQATDD